MKNTGMVELLLEQGSPLETQSEEGFPPLWYALQELSDETREMAIQVIRKGASTNTVRKTLFFKGQLISKCPFGVFKSSQKTTDFFPGFLP